MAVKYLCTKCDRKFVEWGVKKVKAGEACEDCKGESLELIGFDSSQPAPKKKPALKRKRKKKAKKEPELVGSTSTFEDTKSPVSENDLVTAGLEDLDVGEDLGGGDPEDDMEVKEDKPK